MTQEPDFSESKRARFDPTVNLGHILTAIMMGAALVTMWANMKVGQAEHASRLSALEAAQTRLSQTVDKLADNANTTARTQDRLSLTLDYLSKQVTSKP